MSDRPNRPRELSQSLGLGLAGVNKPHAVNGLVADGIQQSLGCTDQNADDSEIILTYII